MREKEVQSLIDSAFEHRVPGLLWTAVETGQVELPRWAVHTLAVEALRSRAYNLNLWRTLAAVVENLLDENIEVACAKGITTEARFYRGLGERSCTDLDLIVAPSDLGRVDEIIGRLDPENGLRRTYSELVSSGVLQSFDLDFRNVKLDVHADVFKVGIPLRGSGDLWRRRVAVAGPEGLGATAPDETLTLVHAVFHLMRDNFSLLHGYADVARMLRDPRVDWDALDDFVGREGLKAQAHAGLWAVVDDLRLDAIPVSRPAGTRVEVWHRLWAPPSRLRGRAGLASGVRRPYMIPWLADGRCSEAAYWMFRRHLLPPRALVSMNYSSTPGRYVRRLIHGRIRVARQRRNWLASLGAVHPTGRW